jgi:hypothetical protein
MFIMSFHLKELGFLCGVRRRLFADDDESAPFKLDRWVPGLSGLGGLVCLVALLGLVAGGPL